MEHILTGVDDENQKEIIDNGSGELPMDVVSEICLRLHIKKVHQFRCVSRDWRSTVSHPGFFKAYDSRNPPGFLFIHGINEQELCREIHYCPIRFNEAEQFIESPLKLTVESKLTVIINGLVCSYSPHHLHLCNIRTGDRVRLPLPKMKGDPRRRAEYFSTLKYFFGFDPVNKLYKLLKISIVDCEILTISSNNNNNNFLWRRIPPTGCDSDFIPKYQGWFMLIGARHFDNTILINDLMFIQACDMIGYFNFSEEITRLLERPDRTLEIPVGSDASFPSRLFRFVQFRGRLTLIRIDDEKNMIVYIMNDLEGYSWTRLVTVLPYDLHSKAVYVGNLPTGEILLAYQQHSSPLLYSYDCDENKFERLAVGRWPCSISHSSLQFLLPG